MKCEICGKEDSFLIMTPYGEVCDDCYNGLTEDAIQ